MYAKNLGEEHFGLDIETGDISPIEKLGIYDH